jgi:hypothetical protein
LPQRKSILFLATENTEDTEDKKVEKEYLSTIWPILYFKADWPSKSDDLGLGIRIIKADKELLEAEWGEESTYYGWKTVTDFYENTKWFLTMPLPKPAEHVSFEKIGMSFEQELTQAIANSFLMCLRLIRQTAAICPVGLKAKLVGDEIDPNSIEDSDYPYHVQTDQPPVYEPESFKLEDLQLLTELWTAIIRLRKLDYWANRVYKEEFFANLDNKAVEDAQRELREFFLSLPVAEDPEARELLLSIAKQTNRSEGDEWWQECHSECLRKAFKAEEDETFSNRTRIGRALNLFYEGLLLPKLHAFLSMCLVLETIFTVEEAEITYQFATRLANLTGKTFEQRKDIFGRARKVYRERSNIVHGRKSIETIESNILKDAFSFARQSLQHILLDDALMKLYSDPITSDKTKDPDNAIKAIKDYFRDLDLRCD